MYVGNVVKLLVPCLGNNIGTVGMVYEEYTLANSSGVSIIFKNGSYDGFSENEQKRFVEKIGHYPMLEDYKFTSVINLSWDFDSGVFEELFKQF